MEIILMAIIGLLILYAVIKSAIDGSETAENIRYIRMILSKQYTETDDNYSNIPKENFKIENIPITECPACGEKISSTDKKCPSCGLTLIFEKDDN
jgi:YgiT-type zinc finger domain-containing protein